mgnify:CR=1 FL=1
MAKILLVEDDKTTISILDTLLKAEGYDVITSENGEQAKALIAENEFDLMISDIRMAPVDGMQLLQTIHEEEPDVAVIMLTAYGSVETAIEALKLGAFDYVTKPFKVDELLITVQRALEYRRARSENIDLRAQLETGCRFSNIVAESPAMKQVCDMIERVAPTDTSVLIYGESGTGKELVARAIHETSRRKNEEFLAVNCAALPESLLESEMFGHMKGSFSGATNNKQGLFEAAAGGTLFLDEISGTPLAIQAKLLRALQEKEVRRVGGNSNIPVDVRVLAATNLKLEEMIKREEFREDLYYRLSVIPIDIAPLRERQEDILPLVYHILKKELGEDAELPTLDPQVCSVFSQFEWPGNVRELENVIKHAITFAKDSVIGVDTLPPSILEATRQGGSGALSDLMAFSGQAKSLKKFLRDKEEEYLRHVLEATGGDKQRAAETLKISLATLYRKLPDLDD